MEMHAAGYAGVSHLRYHLALIYLLADRYVQLCAVGVICHVSVVVADLKKIAEYSLKINQLLSNYLKDLNIELIDFKLEFGKTADGTLVLADEISPDTCRFWDSVTHEKLDKDRFRRDLGGVEDAYQEIMKRLMGE